MADPVWDPQAVANYLVAKAQTILTDSPLQSQRGVPLDSKFQLSFCCTMGSFEIAPYAIQNLLVWTRFWCLFAHRIDGNEEAAEDAIMGIIPQFITLLYQDQSFGGIVSQIEIQAAVSDEPEYLMIRRREHREYPILVRVAQYHTFSLGL